MYCSHCHASNESGSPFCRECGKPLPLEMGGSTVSNLPPALRAQLQDARGYRERGQLEMASDLVAEVIAQAPESAEAHELQGDLFLARGMNSWAAHEFELALKFDPRNRYLQDKRSRAMGVPLQAPPVPEAPKPQGATQPTRNTAPRAVAEEFQYLDSKARKGGRRSSARLLSLFLLLLSLAWILVPELLTIVPQVQSRLDPFDAKSMSPLGGGVRASFIQRHLIALVLLAASLAGLIITRKRRELPQFDS